MKKEVIKAFKLARYGVSAKGNMICMVIFFITGTVFGFLPPEGDIFLKSLWSDLLVICAAMFPSQLLISTDLAFLVQTSPYKKKLQTGLLVKVTFICNFVALIWLLLLKIVSGVLYHSVNTRLSSLVVTGILLLFITALNSVIYKFFLLTFIGIYVFALASGLLVANGKGAFLISAVSPVCTVVFSFCCIILGSLLEYGISKLIYKQELSRFAFGAALHR